MFDYSAEKVITRWSETGLLFVGNKKRLRPHMLDILLSKFKELVTTILNDGFPINGVFEILRHEKLIPDFVTLDMFYRWRRKNIEFKEYSGFVAAENLSKDRLYQKDRNKSFIKTKLSSDISDITLSDKKELSIIEKQDCINKENSNIVLQISKEEPWRIVPTGVLLPLKADDPKNPWKEGAGLHKEKIEWLVYDSITGVIYDPKVKLPLIKTLQYVPCGMEGAYFNYGSNKAIGERLSANLAFDHADYFRRKNKIRSFDDLYSINK